MNRYNRLTPKFALQLAAPHTWSAAICPVLFSLVYCTVTGLPVTVFQGIAILAACILLQSSVNTINDYIDFKHGTDSAQDNVEISDATLVYAGIDPKHALILGTAYLAAGIILGVLASLGSGFMPLLIGMAGALVVVLYSAGPLPVSYIPVGEIVSGFVMGGLIPLGTAAVSDGKLHPVIIIWSLPLIISIGLIMMSNNGSDIEKDIEAQRMTLPVYLGRQHTKTLYHSLVILWIILLCVFPVLLSGPLGLMSAAFLFFSCRRQIAYLLKASLEPGERIRLMRTITKANANGSLSYTLALLLAFIIKGVL